MPITIKKEMGKKITNINDYTPHKISMVICLKCLHRWLACRPKETKLVDLECPNCKISIYVIETGETIVT